jgi:hypothetical protein
MVGDAAGQMEEVDVGLEDRFVVGERRVWRGEAGESAASPVQSCHMGHVTWPM